MNIKQSLLILTFLTGYIITSFGQTNGDSPYSRLGLGDIVDPNLTNIRNMGGTGIAYTDVYQINATNPASYSFLKSSAFDIGLNAKLAQLKDITGSVNLWSGNINNLSLAFPMRNPINDILDRVEKDYTWGMAFHLLPHTLVGYNLQSIDESEDFGKYTRSYTGKGGTYKFLWGNAVSYKGLSLGVHLGYLFGNISNSKSIIFDDHTYALNNYFATDYHVSGFLWDAGLIYTLKFNEKSLVQNNEKKLNKMTIGLTFKSNTNFNTTANILNISRQFSTGVGDTLVNSSEVEGKGTLPSSVGFGVNYYHGDKWNIGINYLAENWSNYTNDVESTKLENAYKVSLGGYYRPNSKSYSNFFNRVKYQFGSYYRKLPISYKGTSIDSYGLTLGMGLPYVYKRKISHANIGVDLGYKGKNSPIQEKYMKINIGFTFNDDSWFIKRKYN